MNGENVPLDHPPIIEAVIDINCDLPPQTSLDTLAEAAKASFATSYPIARKQFLQQHEFRATPDGPPHFSSIQRIGALQFFSEDEKQLVQVRPEGYSFNRLAPYGSLDDYLPQIESTWQTFVNLTQPVMIRRVGLRYINRILLPTVDDLVEFNDFLEVSPHLPDEDRLRFIGFLNQHSAADIRTGNYVNITLTMQPLEGDRLPLIFDIDTFDLRPRVTDSWVDIRNAILSLRELKNLVFRRTLTPRCLNLFRQQ